MLDSIREAINKKVHILGICPKVGGPPLPLFGTHIFGIQYLNFDPPHLEPKIRNSPQTKFLFYIRKQDRRNSHNKLLFREKLKNGLLPEIFYVKAYTAKIHIREGFRKTSAKLWTLSKILGTPHPPSKVWTSLISSSGKHLFLAQS